MEPGSYQAFAVQLALTCASASVAETVTYPIDAVKTRLQLQGQHYGSSTAPRQQLGALATARRVLRSEGLSGLYAGLTPAVARHVVYSGTRIPVYEHLRAAWAPGDGAQPGVGTKLAAGATAGAIGQLVAVPADLVKVRMQVDARAVAEGTRPARLYTGVAQALRSIVASEGGVAGLWRGTSPAVQRAALVNLGELATYDTAKQVVLASGYFADGLPAHAAASVCSGLVATIVSTPADVAKTRIMGQDPSRLRLYAGMLDCLVKTARSEGVGALYKGFLPTWVRLGPWQMVFWVSYEQLRAAAGLGSF
ncbi:hypothetical protein FOA52_006831 [Chlamydomonas sp. UWO 241]|nr:hypothetical protein FOA52_006831 [Chlamydomonas sp. UWO 241]